MDEQKLKKPKKQIILAVRQRRKRIVSVGGFLAYIGQVGVLCTLTAVFFVIGSILSLVSLLGIWHTLTTVWEEPKDIFPNVFTLFMLGVVGLGLLYQAVIAAKMAKQTEPVALQTRQTIAQLTDEESLVRASAEPEGKAEEELLRAVSTHSDTAPEGLLRAHTGRSE